MCKCEVPSVGHMKVITGMSEGGRLAYGCACGNVGMPCGHDGRVGRLGGCEGG